jgi:nucleotide-binding universal stress UspA family protein
MYRKILVPVALDHGIGEAALKVARRVLSDDGAIIALHVHKAPQGSVSAYLEEDVVQAAFDRAKKKLNDRVKDLPNVTARIVKGHNGRTSIYIATDAVTDCTVIGSHRPGLIDYLLGSTAARILRHALCAVHVLPCNLDRLPAIQALALCGGKGSRSVLAMIIPEHFSKRAVE